jgi:hypothetical protein
MAADDNFNRCANRPRNISEGPKTPAKSRKGREELFRAKETLGARKRITPAPNNPILQYLRLFIEAIAIFAFFSLDDLFVL